MRTTLAEVIVGPPWSTRFVTLASRCPELVLARSAPRAGKKTILGLLSSVGLAGLATALPAKVKRQATTDRYLKRLLLIGCLLKRRGKVRRLSPAILHPS
jgi:hypothetical protein